MQQFLIRDLFFIKAAIGMIINTTLLFLLIIFLIPLMFHIGLYGVFKKNNIEPWKAFIPFYNYWLLFEIVNINGLLSLIPVVNFFMFLFVFFKLSRKHNKSVFFSILMVLFSPLFMLLLGFDKSKSAYNSVLNQNIQPNQATTKRTIDNLKVEVSQTSNNESIELPVLKGNINSENSERNNVTNVNDEKQVNNKEYETLDISGEEQSGFMNLNKTQKFCPVCGNPNDVLNKFCISCGYNFEN